MSFRFQSFTPLLSLFDLHLTVPKPTQPCRVFCRVFSTTLAEKDATQLAPFSVLRARRERAPFWSREQSARFGEVAKGAPAKSRES